MARRTIVLEVTMGLRDRTAFEWALLPAQHRQAGPSERHETRPGRQRPHRATEGPRAPVKTDLDPSCRIAASRTLECHGSFQRPPSALSKISNRKGDDTKRRHDVDQRQD